jgi:hypothetical protein
MLSMGLILQVTQEDYPVIAGADNAQRRTVA